MQVPIAQRQVVEQAAPNVQQGYNRVQADASAFGGNQAAQLKALGDQMQQTGGVIIQEQNEAKVRDAINKSREMAREAVQKALSAQGENAIGATDALKKNLSDIKKEVSKGFQFPAQQQMFDAVFDSYAAVHVDNAFSHEQAETRKFNIQTLEAANELTFRDLDQDYAAPDLRTQHLDGIKANTAQIGRTLGWDKNTLELETAKAENAFHLTVAQNYANAGDTKGAMEYLEANKGSVDPKALATMTSKYRAVQEETFAFKMGGELAALSESEILKRTRDMVGQTVDGVEVNLEMAQRMRQEALFTKNVQQAEAKARASAVDNAVVTDLIRQVDAGNYGAAEAQLKKAWEGGMVTNQVYEARKKWIGEERLRKAEGADLPANPLGLQAVYAMANDPSRRAELLAEPSDTWLQIFNKEDRVKAFAAIEKARSGAAASKEHLWRKEFDAFIASNTVRGKVKLTPQEQAAVFMLFHEHAESLADPKPEDFYLFGKKLMEVETPGGWVGSDVLRWKALTAKTIEEAKPFTYDGGVDELLLTPDPALGLGSSARTSIPVAPARGGMIFPVETGTAATANNMRTLEQMMDQGGF